MDTREKMVATAAQLLRRQGFHSTSLVQVVDEGGLPRGSIYHHFPGGKDQLAEEAITYAAAEVTQDLLKVSKAASASKAIERYIQLLSERLEKSGYTEGCWYATTALEVAPNHDGLRKALEAEFTRWTAFISTALVSWGVSPKHAPGCAQLLVAAVEGGLLVARVRRDTAALRALVPYLQSAVEAHLR
jgi:TetR/AcrR family transcriptional repressor of lmrAB and yxaGH operons